MTPTSIEYFINQLDLINKSDVNGSKELMINYIKKAAKAKHKEEIIKAYTEGFANCLNTDLITPEQYYNETFKP